MEETGAVDEVSRSSRRRNVVLVIIRCAASLAMIVAALWLPWSTFEEGARRAITFTAGSLTGSLVALALFTIVLSTATLRWPSIWIRWAILVACACALGFAVVVALHSISSANSVLTHAYSQTSYASGSVLGVLSGVAMTATAVLGLRTP